MRIALVVFGAVLAAGPAFAADEPVATASRTPAPSATAEQIDAYLRNSPALDAPAAGDAFGLIRRDRKVHGVVSVGVGTGGYRSLYVETDMPLGESGRLRLAFEDTRFGRRAPYRHGVHGAPGRFGVSDRRRCEQQAMTAPRPLDPDCRVRDAP